MRSVYSLFLIYSETGLEEEDAPRKDYHLMAFNWSFHLISLKDGSRTSQAAVETWMPQVTKLLNDSDHPRDNTDLFWDKQWPHERKGWGHQRSLKALSRPRLTLLVGSRLCDCTSHSCRTKTLWWVLDIYSSWCKQLPEVTYPQGAVFHNTV